MQSEFLALKAKQKQEMKDFRDKWKANKRTLYKKMNGMYNKDIVRRTKIREELIVEQDGYCVICDEEFGFGKEPHLDHCHETNQIREVLCEQCNIGLGYFKDNTLYFEKAWEYIKKHEEVYKTGLYEVW